MAMDKHDIATDRFFKTRFCLNYLKGKCEKGEKCNYAHSKQEMKLDGDKYYKTKICDAFVKGRCPHDTVICNYAHGQQDLRNPPPLKRQYQQGECQYNSQRRKKSQYKSREKYQQNKNQDKPQQKKNHRDYTYESKNQISKSEERTKIGNSTPQSTRNQRSTQQMKFNDKMTPEINAYSANPHWMNNYPQNRIYYSVSYPKGANMARQNQFSNYPYENMQRFSPYPQFSSGNMSNQQFYYPEYYQYNPYYNYNQVYVPHGMIPSNPNSNSSNFPMAHTVGQNHSIPIHFQSIPVQQSMPYDTVMSYDPSKFVQPVPVHQMQHIDNKSPQPMSSSKSHSSTIIQAKLGQTTSSSKSSKISSKNIVNSNDDFRGKQPIKNSPINRLNNNYKPKGSTSSQFNKNANKIPQSFSKIDSFSTKFQVLKSDMQNKSDQKSADWDANAEC